MPDSYYWQAFALYRRAGTSNLRAAIELLDQQRSRYPNAGTMASAAELRVQLESRLAQQGDAGAAANIAQQASEPCDGDEQETRAAALSALLNMNAERAIPILKQVLQQRDECSADLRRQAVFLISQKMTDESVDILLDLAHRNPDPDPEVREQAVFWLSQVKSPEALQALESILRESKDQDVQEKAIFAISQHGSDEAVRVLREYAERADAPRDLRENAIFWIGQNPKAGGTRYLMDLYPRLNDPELKEKAIFSIAQGNSADSRRWLLERARDRSESVDVRKNALFWAGQTGGLTAAEMKELYGTLVGTGDEGAGDLRGVPEEPAGGGGLPDGRREERAGQGAQEARDLLAGPEQGPARHGVPLEPDRRMSGRRWTGVAAALVAVPVMAAAGMSPRPATAQELGRRIEGAGDGTVRFAIPTRPDVEICDQGIRMGEHRMWWRSHGEYDDASNCRYGPVEVEARVRDGSVRGLDGGPRDAGSDRGRAGDRNGRRGRGRRLAGLAGEGSPFR